jgi:hypothetical protein
MKTNNNNNEKCNLLVFDRIVSHPLNSSVCSMNSYIHFFCPAISKVSTPNHDVRRSLVSIRTTLIQIDASILYKDLPIMYGNNVLAFNIPYAFTFEVAYQSKTALTY